MRFDFFYDKRLMSPNETGGASSVVTEEDKGLAASLAGKTADEQAAIIARWRALVTERGAADKNAGVAGTSGAEAQKAVQQRGAQGQQQNAENAAEKSQSLIQKNLEVLIKQFDQSVAGLMNAEQSIEQMKAGFSGMLQVLGIVAKKLGAEDFGQGCLELAQELKPALVEPSAEGIRRIRALEQELNVSADPGSRTIAGGQDNASSAADRGQARVEDAAIDGVGAAGRIPQPTAIGALRETSSPRTVSTGITASALNSALNSLNSDRNSGLLASEGLSLQDKFTSFAAQGGNRETIDTPTERASFKAAIRMGVSNQGAEQRLLSSLNLAGPNPNGAMGG